KVLLLLKTRGLKMLLNPSRFCLLGVCTVPNGVSLMVACLTPPEACQDLVDHVAPPEQVSGEEKLKAAFEEFKRYEDDRVEKRCAELDARLDALSIDFDEELYLHMLT
nr:hypothetical protein [Tanacetum cinerariifolium]